MGPGGGKQSSGRGVGFEGLEPCAAVAGAKEWDDKPDYEGIDQGVLGELKFVDKPGGKAPKPEAAGVNQGPAKGGVD
jgi:hypothetical protein